MSPNRAACLVLALVLAVVMVPAAAEAHILPGSFLRLNVEGPTVRGTWDLSIYSLAETARLQTRSKRDLQKFALDKLSIESDGAPCRLHVDEAESNVKPNDDEHPQLIPIVGQCRHDISQLTISYFSLLVIDPRFEGLVNVSAHGQTYTSALSERNPSVTFRVGAPDRWRQFSDYVREGIWHIWLGYDHILFLLALLLPAAFVIGGGRWQPRPDKLGGTFWQVAKIVTAFTLAHSVTLSLVIFGIISLPSRLVESAIALSIVIAAANNLHPVLGRKLWLLTFCFGLIHGMGFAGALKELGLPDDARWIALAGFNIGVELGQLAIVAVALPAIYAVRHDRFYRVVFLRSASVVIVAVASICRGIG